jgi:pyrimidine operon attenuation protein/uracil phosphoribosyltransferase
MPVPILDPSAIDQGLRHVAEAIAVRSSSGEPVALVGIRRGGEPLAERLADLLLTLQGERPPVGSLDITLYRDDAATALPNPRIGPSHIPFAVEGQRVVLVDDVLYTGRTIRAALDALLDYGRPKRIELFALIDRGGRELPIAADYVVETVSVPAEARVEVRTHDGELWAMLDDGAGGAP